MRLSCFLAALAWLASPSDAPPSRTVVTLLALSDYHSHAVPFYSEGRSSQGGIARAIAYLKEAKKRPDVLVVSGGDTMNADTPAWSDEYRCLEWSWFNGLIDVMALGNHDLDYGPGELARCRAGAAYPVISANLVGADDTPFLQAEGRPYVVREAGGVRIGFFALGGPDFEGLVPRERLPAGTRWIDAIPMGRTVVEALRGTEKVSAVVFIGHEHREDDETLARAVPGIDLILGTHSHHKSELVRIPGTDTYTISPYQYLAYLSEVRMAFEGGKLAAVEGGLVKMDESRPEDPVVAGRVAELQRHLVAGRPDRFRVLGRAGIELSDQGVSTGESLIGNWATEVLRRATGTHVFFSTASSFRAALPPGDITLEAFHAAIPYRNRVVTAEMSGRQLTEWVTLSASRAGSGDFSQQSGARYAGRAGSPVDIRVLKDPVDPGLGYARLEPDATYKVGTTDFQAFIAAGYRDLFAAARNPVKTDLDVHAALIAALREGPATARLDGRSGGR